MAGLHAKNITVALLSLACGSACLLSSGPAYAAELVACNATPIVVLSGKELPELLSQSISDLRVLTLNNGQWQPGPLQIDERDKKGRYLLKESLGEGWWGDGSSKQPGTLSDNDELLLMLDTAQTQLSQPALPPGTWYAVNQGSHKGSATPWAYVGVPAEDLIPQDSTDSISFNPHHHAIMAPGRYELRYGETGESPLPSDLLVPKEGGNPNEMVDVLDRTGFTVGFTIRGTDAHFERSEMDIQRQLHAWTDGTIRLLLKEKYSVQVLPWLTSPSASAIMKMYPECIEIPATVEVPFDPDILLSKGNLSAYLSLSSDLAAEQVTLDSLPTPVAVETFLAENGQHFSMATTAEIAGESVSPISLRMSYPHKHWASLGIHTGLSLSPAPQFETTEEAADPFQLAWNVNELQRLTRGSYDESLQIIIGPATEAPQAIYVTFVASEI